MFYLLSEHNRDGGMVLKKSEPVSMTTQSDFCRQSSKTGLKMKPGISLVALGNVLYFDFTPVFKKRATINLPNEQIIHATA